MRRRRRGQVPHSVQEQVFSRLCRRLIKKRTRRSKADALRSVALPPEVGAYVPQVDHHARRTGVVGHDRTLPQRGGV